MLKLSYIFEVSKIEKFLIVILILLPILTFTRIVFINLFSKKFLLFYVLIGLNIFICFFNFLIFMFFNNLFLLGWWVGKEIIDNLLFIEKYFYPTISLHSCLEILSK